MAQGSRYQLWWTRLTTHVGSDVPWLVAAAAATALVYIAYLQTHTVPAYEGGLFLDIADQIRRHGYRLPERIPGYTTEGIPFAYPPLMFYLLAATVDLSGADPVSILLTVPGLVVFASLIPYYYTAKELLASSRQAGVATVVFAVTPAVLQWRLSAGGIVRAPAMLFTLIGAYVGIRLFRDRDRRWLVPGITLFGLTVLTHPHYTAFFGLTYLLLFAAYDRTPRGLLRGATVALGGVALAAPWWIPVVLTHGPDVFLAASGTQGGLGGGLGRLERQFIRPVRQADPLMGFYLLTYAGSAYAVARRRYVLPVWMIITSYAIGQNRFLFIAGGMLVGLLVWEVLVPVARRVADTRRREQAATLAVVGVIVLSTAGVGTLFAGSALSTAHQHSTSLPQTVDASDREAMAWTTGHTSEDADVLVLGDVAEWYPYFTDRTIVVSPWGSEWTSAKQYSNEVNLYKQLSTCDGPECLTSRLAKADRDPEYVYVSVGEYTIRGKEYWNGERDISTIAAAEEFRLVHRNDGVAVFRITTDFNSR